MMCDVTRRYDTAEHCTQLALCIDPNLTMARYLRALTRTGNLQVSPAVVGAIAGPLG